MGMSIIEIRLLECRLSRAERERDALAQKVAELRQALTEEMSDEVSRDAARWRWARANMGLWDGSYDYGVFSPEAADQIADAALERT